MAIRFALDKMLGRLATWLRIIGADASYGAHLSGRSLLRHARTEGRVVLTRDRGLLRAAAPLPILLIRSDHFREQLQQVIVTFQLDPLTNAFTRCARCNQPVDVVDKEEIAHSVPPYVLATQTRFVRCPRCRRVYWPATHSAHVRHELGTLSSPDPT